MRLFGPCPSARCRRRRRTWASRCSSSSKLRPGTAASISTNVLTAKKVATNQIKRKPASCSSLPSGHSAVVAVARAAPFFSASAWAPSSPPRPRAAGLPGSRCAGGRWKRTPRGRRRRSPPPTVDQHERELLDFLSFFSLRLPRMTRRPPLSTLTRGPRRLPVPLPPSPRRRLLTPPHPYPGPAGRPRRHPLPRQLRRAPRARPRPRHRHPRDQHPLRPGGRPRPRGPDRPPPYPRRRRPLGNFP